MKVTANMKVNVPSGFFTNEVMLYNNKLIREIFWDVIMSMSDFSYYNRYKWNDPVDSYDDDRNTYTMMLSPKGMWLDSCNLDAQNDVMFQLFIKDDDDESLFVVSYDVDGNPVDYTCDGENIPDSMPLSEIPNDAYGIANSIRRATKVANAYFTECKIRLKTVISKLNELV
jgi:hypothetical protein